MIERITQIVIFEISFYVIVCALTLISLTIYKTGLPFFQLATIAYLILTSIRLAVASTLPND